MENVVQLISSVGFPIVCCLALWKSLNTTIKELTKAINNNTRTIDKLCGKMEREENENAIPSALPGSDVDTLP